MEPIIRAMKSSLRDDAYLKDLRRKVARVVMCSFLFLMAWIVYNNYGAQWVRNITFVLCMFAIAGDYLRLNYGAKVPFLEPFIAHAYEREGFHGISYASLGVTLALAFFDYDIALASIAIFVYGDFAAGVIGKIFGKTQIFNKKKTVAGSVAMFIAAFIAARLIISDGHLAVFMVLFATLVEFSVETPADDFAIPVFTAFGGQFFGSMLGERELLPGFWFGIVLAFVTTGLTVVCVVLFNQIRRLFSWLKRSST
jgi:dolichol kinase